MDRICCVKRYKILQIRSAVWDDRIKAVFLGIACALVLNEAPLWLSVFNYSRNACRDCAPDFFALYTGAQLLWRDADSLYDVDQQFLIQQQLFEGQLARDNVLAFAYPPFVAGLLLPLGWLSFPTAFFLMMIVNAILITLVFRKLVKALQMTRNQSQWLLIFICCNVGVHRTFLLGQTSFLALLILVHFVISLNPVKQYKAGFCSALLLVKPQLALVPFLILAHQRYWRAFVLSLATGFGLTILSIALVGIEGARAYLRLIGEMSTARNMFGVYPDAMHTLRILVEKLFPPPGSMIAWLATGLSVILALLWSMRNQGSHSGRFVLNGCAIVLAVLLLAPHLNTHDLALLILPCALILTLFEGLALTLIGVSLPVLGFLPFVIGEVPSVSPAILLASFIVCVTSSLRADRIASSMTHE